MYMCVIHTHTKWEKNQEDKCQTFNSIYSRKKSSLKGIFALSYYTAQ